MASKKQTQQNQLKAVLAKDIATKNPVFSNGAIAQMHAVFCLYADPRQRRSDIRDILLTASTLGLDSKYEIAFRLLQQIQESPNGNNLSFQQFLKQLTNRIGNPFTQDGRRNHFDLLDFERKGELTILDLKYINQQLKYGYDEDQLWQLIHSVGGYNSETISYQRFNQYIKRRVEKRKAI